MTARKSKPWRVIVTGPDVTAQSDHGSEDKAYTFVRVALGPGSPATQAIVQHWEDGHWRAYEIVAPEDII